MDNLRQFCFRQLAEKYGHTIASCGTLPVEKQKGCRNLLKDYYSSIAESLKKHHRVRDQSGVSLLLTTEKFAGAWLLWCCKIVADRTLLCLLTMIAQFLHTNHPRYSKQLTHTYVVKVFLGTIFLAYFKKELMN